MRWGEGANGEGGSGREQGRVRARACKVAYNSNGKPGGERVSEVAT